MIREDLIATVPAADVPPDVYVGANIQGTDVNGNMINVTVTKLNEEEKTVELDANHSLAGKKLFFEIEVVDFETITE